MFLAVEIVMSGSPDDAAITRYIQSLSQLSQDTSNPPSQQELEALAIEVGIAPEIIAKARQQAQAQFAAGVQYLQNEQWDAAISALDQSLALNPLNAETAYQLAVAHYYRATKTGDVRDRETAIALLNRCLTQDPQHALAPGLRQKLSSRPRHLPPRVWLMVGATSLVFFGVLAIGWLTVQRVKPEIQMESVEVSEAIAPPPAPTAPPLEDYEFELPITLTDSITEADMEIEVRQSRLQNFEDKSYYNLIALLKNNSDEEWQAVILNLQVLDRAGNILVQKSLQALDTYQPVLRPGDAYPFSTILTTNSQATTVRMALQLKNDVPASGQYDVGKEIPVIWEQVPPSHWQLQVQERQFNVSNYGQPDDNLDVTFAIKNAGDGTFRTLRLEMRLLNEVGDRIDTEEIQVVYGSSPALLPGETRVERWLAPIPSGVERYELVVVEAQ
jgi:tetratricopeptide (TPR) repeat protein